MRPLAPPCTVLGSRLHARRRPTARVTHPCVRSQPQRGVGATPIDPPPPTRRCALEYLHRKRATLRGSSMRCSPPAAGEACAGGRDRACGGMVPDTRSRGRSLAQAAARRRREQREQMMQRIPPACDARRRELPALATTGHSAAAHRTRRTRTWGCRVRVLRPPWVCGGGAVAA